MTPPTTPGKHTSPSETIWDKFYKVNEASIAHYLENHRRPSGTLFTFLKDIETEHAALLAEVEALKARQKELEFSVETLANESKFLQKDRDTRKASEGELYEALKVVQGFATANYSVPENYPHIRKVNAALSKYEEANQKQLENREPKTE